MCYTLPTRRRKVKRQRMMEAILGQRDSFAEFSNGCEDCQSDHHLHSKWRQIAEWNCNAIISTKEWLCQINPKTFAFPNPRFKCRNLSRWWHICTRCWLCLVHILRRIDQPQFFLWSTIWGWKTTLCDDVEASVQMALVYCIVGGRVEVSLPYNTIC